MCYAKPGPRCSTHARNRLHDITERLAHTTTGTEAHSSLTRELYIAQEEYDSTSSGQRDLRQQIEDVQRSPDKSALPSLVTRLDKGKSLRQVLMGAWKEQYAHKNGSVDDKSALITGTGHDSDIPEALSLQAEKPSFIEDETYRNIKKMPALFVIDRTKHQATTEINENAAWIFSEPSRATIKRDGTSITVTEDGTVLARRSVKKGKAAPEGYIEAEVDPVTGHSFGVEPIGQSPFAKPFKQAAEGKTLAPGTYELCGPKVNGNPEQLDSHALMAHGEDEAVEIPDMRTMPREDAYNNLREIFSAYHDRGIEGVVWWGEGGKRTKLRVKDFFGDPNRR